MQQHILGSLESLVAKQLEYYGYYCLVSLMVAQFLP